MGLVAAGVSGPELLFQATSEEMIEAYSHVPWYVPNYLMWIAPTEYVVVRPYGTVLANDIFTSGIVLSEYVYKVLSTTAH